jgi:L-fuculose-phosphate aldolase
MQEWEIKEQICDIGRRVWQREYVAANDGNFSVRLDEDRVLATPTMVSKGFMTPDDIVTVDMDGRQIAGDKKMTSEVKLHLQIYRERADVKAVVHAHPPRATAFAVVQEPIPKCVLSEVEVSLGEIPITRYDTPGSQACAETIKPYLHDFNLFLLANHGALSLGEDLIQAYYRMEMVEQYCRILLYARQLGGHKQIDQDKMSELFQLKERLGYADRRTAPGGNVSCSIPSPTPDNHPAENSPGAARDELQAQIGRIVQKVIQERQK